MKDNCERGQIGRWRPDWRMLTLNCELAFVSETWLMVMRKEVLFAGWSLETVYLTLAPRICQRVK